VRRRRRELLEELFSAKKKRQVLLVLLDKYNKKVKEIKQELIELESNYNF